MVPGSATGEGPHPMRQVSLEEGHLSKAYGDSWKNHKAGLLWWSSG